MDETGSVGLDLSFAGAVFLMEPLADAALEQQVGSGFDHDLHCADKLNVVCSRQAPMPQADRSPQCPLPCSSGARCPKSVI